MDEAGSLYQEAVALGQQLMELLNAGLRGRDLDRLEVLVDRREAIAAHTARLAQSGVDLSPFRESLEALVSQQAHLETALQQAMTALNQRREEQQRQQYSLQAVSRILNPGTQSRLINTIR